MVDFRVNEESDVMWCRQFHEIGISSDVAASTPWQTSLLDYNFHTISTAV
ncbi:hypothetical protein TSMEX_000552 [Taenia solium]|eukprot:TsM_000153000 transcript=TsM_000153000 gene=TsM_000153000